VLVSTSCIVARQSISSLYAGERLAKNIFKETTATIQKYNNVLDTLMQRFRDLAVRDTSINVHEIGESVPLYRECSLTLEPLT
jgi:hypothetical protein